MLFLSNASDLIGRIEGYFRHIKGDDYPEAAKTAQTQNNEAATNNQANKHRPPEPALLTGLALFIGFASMDDFVAYEQKGKHKKILRTARLRVEAEYEKKLHLPAPTGAMFALRCMGWADTANAPQSAPPKKIRVEIVEAGPKVSGSEKDVIV